MIQLLLGLTFFAFFVITIFVSSVSVPIYALITRGRWALAAGYILVTFAWIWGMQHFMSPELADVPASAPEIWWNTYWWMASLVFYQCVGIAMGVAVLNQWGTGRAIFIPVLSGSLVLAAAVVAVVVYGPTYLGQDVGQFITTEVDHVVHQTIAYYEAANIPQDQLAMLKAVGEQMMGGISFVMLPAIVWLMGLAATMLTLLLGKWLVPRSLWMKYQGGLTRWKAPSFCIWLVIVLGALYFANLYVMKMAIMIPVVSNGLLALGGLFLLQGALILVYYIRRQRDGIFRWVWYGLILLFFQTALIIMVVLGLFDYWVDFRRIEKRSLV